jgi:hypothetical protein
MCFACEYCKTWIPANYIHKYIVFIFAHTVGIYYKNTRITANYIHNKYYGLLLAAIYFAQAFFIEKHGLRYHIAIIYTD